MSRQRVRVSKPEKWKSHEAAEVPVPLKVVSWAGPDGKLWVTEDLYDATVLAVETELKKREYNVDEVPLGVCSCFAARSVLTIG